MDRKAPLKLAFLLLLVALASSTFGAGILRVPFEYPTIQAAINAASNGDTVLVAPGVYAEFSVAGKAIVVRGEGSEHAAIISAPANLAAVTCNSAETTNTVIAGFTVLNGAMGFNIQNCSPTVLDNVISNCVIGIEAKGSSAIIVSNSISKAANVGINLGGGFFPSIRNNRIFQNNTGVLLEGGEPTFQSNLIYSNANRGISATGNSDPVLLQNVIYGNGSYAVSWISSLGRRGATLVHNTIIGDSVLNIAAVRGTGSDGASVLLNNIIVGTPALDLTVTSGFNSLNVANNLFFAPVGTPVISDSQIMAPQNNNLTSDPKFLDAAIADFQLLPGSPAIDIGAVTTLSLPNDFLGAARSLDGNQDGSAVPDLGAFEFFPGPPRPTTSLMAVAKLSEISLLWRPFDSATNYILARSLTPNGPYQTLVTTTNTSFTDADVVKDSLYFYTLAGVNSFGQGLPSLPVSAKAGNLPPVANADTFFSLEDTVAEVFPLNNDSDPNNDPLTIVRLEGAIPPGLILTSSNSIRYLPPTNTVTNVTVTYVIGDGRLAFATNTVSLRVIPVNDPPVALAQSFTVNGDTNTIIRPVISDPDSTNFQFVVEQPPLHGSIVPLANGTLEYRPDWGYAGSDSATLVFSDGLAVADPFVISFTVVAPPDIDNDFMADFWENFWDLNSPVGDPDGDGFNNLLEFLANTSPRNPQSTLKISRIEDSEGHLPRIIWPSVGGVRYRIFWTDSISSPFQPILRAAQSEIDQGFYGVAGIQAYIDARPLQPGTSRFYRIAVVK